MTNLIILAAGESSRFGQPKQNLLFNGQTLLERAVESGQVSKVDTITVVLGANASMIEPVPGTVTIYNDQWQEGIGTSIRCAISEISHDSSIDKVMIMLCDQPFVNPALLNTLIDKQA